MSPTSWVEEVRVLEEEGKVDRWWVDGVFIGAQKKAARPGETLKRPFAPSWNKVTLNAQQGSGLCWGLRVWGGGSVTS
jgi:hypothetical protein